MVLVAGSMRASVPLASVTIQTLPPPAAVQQASQNPYDPYAGAAVPQR